MTELAPAIRAFFDATNAEDSEALLAAFADDAVLDDWGRTFTGKDEIAWWNRDENIGVHARMRVLGATMEGDTTTVQIEVAGDGYNGGGAFVIRTGGGLIEQFLITG